MKICSVCKENISVLATKNPAACHKCYIRPKRNCSICGKYRLTNKKDVDGKSICRKCYTIKKETCYVCLKLRAVNTRDKNNNPICISCYSRPIKICSICGFLNRVEKKIDGNNICIKCYIQPCKKCIDCQKDKSVALNTTKGPICKVCYNNRKRANDEIFRLKCILRSRLHNAFAAYSQNGKIKKSDEYGINYQAIIDHLGPCPGKRGEYHIDHIVPLCKFDFNDERQVKQAFAPENHQWLTKEENLKKGSK